jgi:hypothetical protein
MKPKFKINRKEFIEWYFDSGTMESLGEDIYDTLLKDEVYTVTLDDIIRGVGYIPISMVGNLDEVKYILTEQELEDETVEDFGDRDFEVEWI